MSNETLDKCLRALDEVGVPPVKDLGRYMELLLEWNQKINLTGAKDSQELALKHVADVWAATQNFDIGHTIVDVGSGGGIPGLLLAIISQKSQITLVERRQKKASAIASIVSRLNLEHQVRVIAKSFEEIKTFPKEAEYWFRGFLPGPKLASYLSIFFPRADIGQIVLMKGPAWLQEKADIMSQQKVKSAWQKRFAESVEISYELPKNAGERVLVLV